MYVRASWKSLEGDFKVCGSTLVRVVASPWGPELLRSHDAGMKQTLLHVNEHPIPSELRMNLKSQNWIHGGWKWNIQPIQKKLTFHETVLKIYRTSIVITSLKRLASQLSALSEVCFIFLGTLLYRPPICASYIHQCASYNCQYVCQLLLSAKTWTSF